MGIKEMMRNGSIIALSVILSLFAINPLFAFQVQNNVTDTAYVHALLDSADLSRTKGNLEGAKDLLAKVDSISNQYGFQDNPFINARSLLSSGRILMSQQKIDSAIVLFERGIEEFGETPVLSTFYNELGNVYRTIGECEQAIPIFEQALRNDPNYSETAETQFIAGVKMNIATCYVSLGLSKEAIQNFLPALEFAQNNDDAYLGALANLNIGQSYSTEDDYDRAIYYYEKAIEISERAGLKEILGYSYNNLGVALMVNGELAGSEEVLQKAEDIYREINPNAPPLPVFVNYGQLYREMEQYEKAESYLREALEFERQINYPLARLHIYQELGQLYYHQAIYEVANQYLTNSLQISQQISSSTDRRDILETIYNVNKDAGNFRTALQYHEQLKTLSDSLSSAREELKLSGLQSQLELNRQTEINQLLEEKQAQQEARIQFQRFLIIAGAIILLLIGILFYITRKSAKEREKLFKEIEARKTELEEINKAKDQVFAMVSHDLRSPLTSVQGILDLVRHNMLNGEDLKRLIDDVDTSVRENVNVIEDLLAWAKEQLSGFDLEPKPVPLKPLITDVMTTQSFLAIQKKIELKNSLNGQDHTILADQNALRVIFRNLISNAIKYTNEGGQIKIDVQSGEQNVVIQVQDNGIGIPKASIDKIFNSKSWTRAGTGREKGSGFGLSMTKEFVEKMNGRIWFESKEGEGTTFFVEFPKAV